MLWNVAQISTGILRVRCFGRRPGFLNGIRREQLRAGNADVFAAVTREYLRRMFPEPGDVASILLTPRLCFGQMTRICNFLYQERMLLARHVSRVPEKATYVNRLVPLSPGVICSDYVRIELGGLPTITVAVNSWGHRPRGRLFIFLLMCTGK